MATKNTTTKTEDQHELPDDLKHAITVHERVIDFAQGLIDEGLDPDVVVGTLMTIGIDGTLKTRGRLRTMSVLLDTYRLIWNAVVADAERPAPTMQ